MRRTLIEFAAAGGEGLDPVAAKAVSLLAAEADAVAGGRDGGIQVCRRWKRGALW